MYADSSGETMIRKKISVSNTSYTYIDKNNIMNNKSRANFVKTLLVFSTKKNLQLGSKNEDEESGEDKRGIRNENLKQSPEKPKNKSQNKSIETLKEGNKMPIANTNGFFGSDKYLHEVLDHLTDAIRSIIRTKCGKNFTNRAIREIAKAVSRSKKGAKAFFYHIKGFIAYLAKILTFEKKRSCSNTKYKLLHHGKSNR